MLGLHRLHYIISSIMMGGVVGVSHSVGGGILVQAISGVVVGAIWGAAATTFAAGYAAYNNPRKYVESITDQVSSGAANIKYGLNWTWDTIVSSYEFVWGKEARPLSKKTSFLLLDTIFLVLACPASCKDIVSSS